MTDREWAAPESSSLSSWRTRLTSALPTLHGASIFIDCGHPSRVIKRRDWARAHRSYAPGQYPCLTKMSNWTSGGHFE